METSASNHLRGRTAGHVIMFWFLAFLAVLVFIPCVLTPIWIETEELYAVEQRIASTLTRLEEKVERNEQRALALLTDPLVNQRVARRELNLQSESEKVLHWTSEELAAMQSVSTPSMSWLEDDAPGQFSVAPGWLQRASSWLPDWPWRKLFAESPQRPLLMLMSGGLLLAAFILYAPTPASRRPR